MSIPAAWEQLSTSEVLNMTLIWLYLAWVLGAAWCPGDAEGNHLFYLLFIIVLLTVLLRRQIFSVSSELKFLNLHFTSASFDLKAVCRGAPGKPAHPFTNGYLLYISE